MIDPEISGKVVLITGANHGIGAAMARAFADQDAKVFITHYRNEHPYSDESLVEALSAGIGGDVLYRANQQRSIETLLSEIQDQGGNASAYEADLADASNIPKLFDQCERDIGPVDILINNHAHCVCETFDPALAETAEDGGVSSQLVSAPEIDAHFAINARAVALMMSEYLKRHRMRKVQWGRIINISTDAAAAHTANVSYAASKHAIESYSRSAASEMGKYGICVNVIAPGPIQTGYIAPEMVPEIEAGTPLGRVGEPEHIADVAVFLASRQARWLTGQLLFVGGGYRMPQ